MDRHTHPVTRRRLLATAGAGATAGLAGCGGGSDDPAGSGDPGGSTPTDAGGDTPAGTGEDSCSDLSADLQPFDTSGSPLVFDFDYSTTWRDRFRRDEDTRYRVVAVSPELTLGGVEGFVSLEFHQPYDPFTAAGVEEELGNIESSLEVDLTAVSVLDFGGEAVDVYSTSGYPEEVNFHVLWLPHGSDYYQVKMIFGSTLLAETDGTLEMLCVDTVRSETERVVGSIRPNSGTTIDS